MKQALCLKNINDFNAMSDGEIETISFEFVDREICEKPENSFFQLIPYVSFHHFDGARSRFDLLTYRRPSSGEGEARLQGNTSCGFGGHVDNEEDLQYTSKETREDGKVVYQMNLDDIKQTAILCARRELTEELGFDPLNTLGVDPAKIIFTLEREQEPDEVGTVHVCVSIKVALEEAQFAQLMQTAKPEAAEVLELNAISLDVGLFMGSFNVVEAMKHLEEQLTKELKMEKWSILVISSMFINMVEFVQRNWNLQDVLSGIFSRIQQEQETAEQQQQQEQEGIAADGISLEEAQSLPNNLADEVQA